MIRVKVPATTANLGPGFDCLGIALNLYNTIEIQENSDSLVIECDTPHLQISLSQDNLIYKSIKRMYSYSGKEAPLIRIKQYVNIPVSRGLGSSAACIIGGLAAANCMLGNPYDNNIILKLASELEGHPDNAAPALFGGLTVAVADEECVRYVRHPLKNLKLMAVIPDFTLSTRMARAVLPFQIDYKHAVFNTGMSSLLTASLITGHFENIKYAVCDRLHQPYRLPLITDSKKIFDAAEGLGVDAMFISGSGPTLMGIITDDGTANKMRNFCSSLKSKWDIKILEVDNCGVQVLKE